jgi:S-adenosyl-L-methionine hydrolase (adenosine-forming)
MTSRPVVAILTDFGVEDTFVGQMKGVILSQCPNAALIDLTHSVPAQDILAGAFHVGAAWHWLPEGTIHVCVVDPGVGSERRAIAVQAAGHTFLSPDNGLLSALMQRHRVDAAFDISGFVPESAYVSRTFHGRDLFAQVAGRLAAGARLDELGNVIDPDELIRIDLPEPEVSPNSILGEIIMIDHWGNAITNISSTVLGGPDENWAVECGDARTDHLSSSYADAAVGGIVAVVSSMDTVEIAVRDASAASRYDLQRGMPVTLTRLS